jgi:hypothetical protein
VKPGKPVTVVGSVLSEPTSPPLTVTAGNGGFGIVQVTPVPPRAAKFAARPREGADAATTELMFELERIAGELILDAGSLLHAAESSANVTTTPAANLCAASVRAGRFGTLCAYMWASLASGGFQSANFPKEPGGLAVAPGQSSWRFNY